MSGPQQDSESTKLLLREIRDGDQKARAELFARYQDLVRSTVQRRLARKLQPRLDPSDVVQETQLELMNRLDEYLQRCPMSFRLWVLRTAHQRVLTAERFHLKTAKRTVDLEVPLPDRSSLDLAQRFVSHNANPDDEAHRIEVARTIRRILARMSEPDRELIMLRNFDALSNEEVADVLELNPETTKKRYSRALLRLRRLCAEAGLTGREA